MQLSAGLQPGPHADSMVSQALAPPQLEINSAGMPNDLVDRLHDYVREAVAVARPGPLVDAWDHLTFFAERDRLYSAARESLWQ